MDNLLEPSARNKAKQPPPLQAYTRVVTDRKGSGAKAVAIPRPFLHERTSHDLLELQIVFVDQEHANAALNTQIAILADLSFLLDWCRLRRARDPSWVFPELRAKAGLPSLLGPEIAEFSTWAALHAHDLSRALELETSSKQVRNLAKGSPIDNGQFNRRLQTTSTYLQWIMRSMISSGAAPTLDKVAAVEAECRRIAKAFKGKLKARAKYTVPKSLKRDAAAQLRRHTETKAATACGERDRLISALLLEGLRAGELLKLRTFDLDEFYEVDDGEIVSIVSILRQPNSVDDPRIIPPSVKTLPGDLAISKLLAHSLVEYVNTWRRDTLDEAGLDEESHYIFVCHQGPQAGQPISQRNLNRIVAKLKGRGVLPQSIAPHVLRHTHMDEVSATASANGEKKSDIREALLQRGRWSEKSDMPRHYTRRETLKQSARLIEERDRHLGLKS